MYVAGRNNRYNTVQIDGAVDNDLFGLADTGTPGGQADTQPISLDAVAQLQMVVSPYDVRQGGFTGGGLNAVTRTGTNKLTGSVYGSKRDQQFVGNGPFDEPISSFDEKQYGARLGGRQHRRELLQSGRSRGAQELPERQVQLRSRIPRRYLRQDQQRSPLRASRLEHGTESPADAQAQLRRRHP